MRKLFLFAAIAYTANLQAQISPALQSLVDAENNFARISIAQNTRAAFLANFDEKSIAFSGGNPHPGREDWEKREADDGYLFWWPVWADISAAGDLGYTTGPAEFGGTIAEKKPLGGIYYSSVWRKGADGKWTIAADLGSAKYNPAEPLKELKVSSLQLAAASTKGKGTADEKVIFDLDRKYISALNEHKASFDASYLAQECRIHRPGREPYINEAAHSLTEPQEFKHEFVGGGVASSADLAYTYGKVEVHFTRDGKEVTLPMCYMRIWKKHGQDWKIVLDVIGQ